MTTAGGRSSWIDTARGSCGLAVVVHHATALSAEHGPLPVGWTVLDDALSPFRMPLLMFVSGMLLPRSAARGTARFLNGRFRSLVWPYLLWSVVTLAVLGPFTVPALVRIPFTSPTYLWFLWFLVLFSLVGLALCRTVGSRHLATVATVSAGLSLAAAACLPDVHRAPRAAYLLAFFLAGCALTAARNRRPARPVASTSRSAGRRWLLTLGACAALGAGAAAAAGIDVRYVPAWTWGPLGLVVVVISVAEEHDRRRSGAAAPCGSPVTRRRSALALTAVPLSWIGRHAIVFYVTHVSAIALTLSVMERLAGGRPDPDAAVAVSSLVAVAIAVGLAAARRFVAVDALFVAPDPRRRSGPTPPSATRARARTATRGRCAALGSSSTRDASHVEYAHD